MRLSLKFDWVTVILMFSSHSVIDLLVSLGSLSCCITISAVWHVAYTLVHWGVHVWLSDWKVLRSMGCKTSPNHHSSKNCDWMFARVVSANRSRAAMFREKRLSPSKQAILAPLIPTVLQWTWKFNMPTEACRVWDGALGFSAASLTLGLTLGSFAGTSTPAMY